MLSFLFKIKEIKHEEDMLTKEELKGTYIKYTPEITKEVFNKITKRLEDLGKRKVGDANEYSDFKEWGIINLNDRDGWSVWACGTEGMKEIFPSDILGEEKAIELVKGEWYEINTRRHWYFKFDRFIAPNEIWNTKAGHFASDKEPEYKTNDGWLQGKPEDCKPANMEEVYKLFPEERGIATERKELTPEDLIEGEIYVYEYDDRIFVSEFRNWDGDEINESAYINITDNIFENDPDDGVVPENLRYATAKEGKWLRVCIKENKFIDEEDLNYYDDNGDLIKKPPKKSKKVKQSISMEKKEESLPFKVGDKVRIKSKPDAWSSALNPNDGRYKVKYPYEMIIEAIEYRKDTNHIAISDGLYGWTYKPDLFEKVEEQEWWKSLKKGDYVVCIEEGHDLVYKNHIYDVIDIDEDGWISHSILENGSTNNGYEYVNYRLATPEEIKMYEEFQCPVPIIKKDLAIFIKDKLNLVFNG